MHTRRLAAFLLGAWLFGSLLFTYVSMQSIAQVERIIATPPQQLTREIDNMGYDVTRQLLRYQSVETTRHLYPIWGVLEIGMAISFLVAVTLTAHRSRILIVLGGLMLILTGLTHFWLNPSLTATGRAVDFLAPGATSFERTSYENLLIWQRVFEVLKILLGVAVAGRLLVDRYGWKDKLIPGLASHSGSQRRRRRRRRTTETSVTDENSPQVVTPRSDTSEDE